MYDVKSDKIIFQYGASYYQRVCSDYSLHWYVLCSDQLIFYLQFKILLFRDFQNRDFVKLQSKVQASALGLGVDFVFPLSQEEQEQEQEQPSPKYTRRRHPRSLKFNT